MTLCNAWKGHDALTRKNLNKRYHEVYEGIKEDKVTIEDFCKRLYLLVSHSMLLLMLMLVVFVVMVVELRKGEHKLGGRRQMVLMSERRGKSQISSEILETIFVFIDSCFHIIILVYSMNMSLER